MEQDFFKNLPQEITIKILSKLPFKTTVVCQCVQKSWLSLTETPEFITSYFSQESFPTGLAFFQNSCPKPLKILEFVDDLDPQTSEFVDDLDPQDSADPCRLAMKFSFSFPHHQLEVDSSVNGLLLMIDFTKFPRDVYICNPITREYVMLPPPPPMEASSSERDWQTDAFGFGVSRVSGQYKVVRMFREFHDDGDPFTNPWLKFPCKCEVLTLETGSWRSVAGPPTTYAWEDLVVFLNGSLHWLVSDSERIRWILYFDLETEVFTTFSVPLDRIGHNVFDNLCMCALEDRLCLCDNSVYEIAIWLMDEYGDEQSWRKDIAISKLFFSDEGLFPIKVYTDGDVLMAKERSHEVFLCSSETGAMERMYLVEYFCKAVAYTPSFLPLKTYTKENSSLVIKPTETEISRLLMRKINKCIELVKGDSERMNALLRDLRDLNHKLETKEENSSTVKRVKKKSLRRCSKCKKKTNHDARNCGKM